MSTFSGGEGSGGGGLGAGIAGIGDIASNIGGIFTSIKDAKTQATYIQAEGEYQKARLEFNSRLSTMLGQDAIHRGETDILNIRRQTNTLIGTQRASFGAQGVDVNLGTAADIQSDTAAQSEIAIMQVRSNAWREAWGYKVQAEDQSGQALLSAVGTANRRSATIATGGINAVRQGSKAIQGLGDIL